MATGSFRGLDYYDVDELYSEEERAIREVQQFEEDAFPIQHSPPAMEQTSCPMFIVQATDRGDAGVLSAASLGGYASAISHNETSHPCPHPPPSMAPT